MDIDGTSRDNNEPSDNIEVLSDLITLTQVPAVPSTFGNDDVLASSDDQDDKEAEPAWDDEYNDDVAPGITVQQGRYNLRPRYNANYSFLVRIDVIDGPTLSERCT